MCIDVKRPGTPVLSKQRTEYISSACNTVVVAEPQANYIHAKLIFGFGYLDTSLEIRRTVHGRYLRERGRSGQPGQQCGLGALTVGQKGCPPLNLHVLLFYCCSAVCVVVVVVIVVVVWVSL